MVNVLADIRLNSSVIFYRDHEQYTVNKIILLGPETDLYVQVKSVLITFMRLNGAVSTKTPHKMRVQNNVIGFKKLQTFF